jgi:CBS domain containing-hemolysin-like protein
MLEFGHILLLGILPLLLVASGFVSGSETALFSLSDHQRLELKRNTSVAATSIIHLLADTRGLLITLMLSNMIVNVLYFVIATVMMIDLEKAGSIGPLALGVLTILQLLMLILCGEVLPKLVAVRFRRQWSMLAAVPLMVIHKIFSPLRMVLSVLVITPLARLIAPRHRPPPLSAGELEALLTLSQQRGVIDAGEERLLLQVLELSQMKVRHLMTPRVDIDGFDLDEPPGKLMDMVMQTRLSRIPVYRDNLDRFEGIIFARQALLRQPATSQHVAQLVRPVPFVPEQQRADELLAQMRESGDTFAVVVDEYGGTAGLITIEDLVEHIVGDIPGAYETQSQPRVESLGDGAWRVGADLAVADWAPTIGSAAAPASVTTLGGLVMAKLGRLPAVGDRVTMGDVTIEVEQMEGRRIATLRIELRREEVSP